MADSQHDPFYSLDSGEHDHATELLASVNPWPDLPGSQ
jgi:hypothetical protein